MRRICTSSILLAAGVLALLMIAHPLLATDTGVANAGALYTVDARVIPERHTGVVNVTDWGAKGDGTTDDTAAIKAAAQAAQITRSEPSGIGGTFQTGPVLVFPQGKYIISDEIALNVLEVRGEGRPIIQQTDPGKDIFTRSDTWRISVANISFSGGRNQINFKNTNIDNGQVIIQGCRFYGAAGFAVRTDVLSTTVQITECTFIRNHQTWYNGRSDQACIKNCWIMAGNGMSDMAAIEHRGGILTLENITGVPEPYSGALRQRWIDNYGAMLIAREFRFGGEGGGFTPIYNYTKYSDSTFGSSIIIENSFVFANASNNANCAVYCYEVPNSIRLRDTTFGGATGVIIDPKVNINTYFRAASPDMFSYIIDGCTGERLGKLPKGLQKPKVNKPNVSTKILSDKDTKQALDKARQELAGGCFGCMQPKQPEFVGGKTDSHVQQTEPGKFVEFTDWKITDYMDATLQKNSDWLALEKVGSDVAIVFRQPQPGGWPHATAKIAIDLDKYPVLTWKLRQATAPGAFVMKALDVKTGNLALVGGVDSWGEYGTGEEYKYYARDLREILGVGGLRDIEVRLYPISSYVWDSRAAKAGQYIVVDFVRMESK
jgi:hypothetical protein